MWQFCYNIQNPADIVYNLTIDIRNDKTSIINK